MSKMAFVFPGQGSQVVGMGKDLFTDYNDELFPLVEAIDRLKTQKFLKLLWYGPEEELNLTTNTQPGIFTISAAISDILKQKGVKPDYVAGHSLGEYSALYYSGCFGFEQGLHIVSERSKLMEKAMPAGTGTMAAVIGLAPDKIEEVCTNAAGVVEVANYNNQKQTIISGEKEAVLAVIEPLKVAGAKRVIELKVSGPFHSSLMKSAAENFQNVLGAAGLKDPLIPIVANVTGLVESTSSEVTDNLVKQLYSSVRWLQTIEYLIKNDVKMFVEIGPGKVLTNLIKKINSEVLTFSISNSEELKSFQNAFVL